MANDYIKKIRKQYPQYNDIDDVALAKAYRKMHYSDIDEDAFMDKIGMHQPTFTERAAPVVKSVLDTIIPDGEPIKSAAQRRRESEAPTEPAAPAQPVNPFVLPQGVVSEDSTTTRPFVMSKPTPKEEFDGTFAPKMLSPAEQDALVEQKNKETFSTQTELSDYGNSIMKGAANLYKAGGWAVGEIGEGIGSDGLKEYGQAMRDTGSEAAAYWEGGMSQAAKDARDVKFVARDANGDVSVGDTLANIVNNPATVGLMAGESLPATGLGMGIGGVITKGFTLIPQVGKQVASAFGYGLGEGAVAAASSGVGTEDSVLAMKHEKLMEHPEYRAVYLATGDEAQAKKIIADAAGDDAAALSFVTTTLLSAPFGYTMSHLFSPADDAAKLVRENVARNALKDGAGEMGQEMLQSGAETVAQNYSINQHADTSVQLGDNVLESIVAGGVAGFGMGATMGAGQTAMNNRKVTQYENALEDQRDAMMQREYNNAMLGGGLEMQLVGDPMEAFAAGVDEKINAIRTSLTNLSINHPEFTIPEEAKSDPVVAETIIAQAQEQGLNLSDNNGLNQIDTSFAQLADEMGVDLTPVANTVQEPIEQTQPIIDIPIIGQPEPEAVVKEDLTTQPINTDRLKELEAIPDDELTVEQQWELEDLRKAQENENFTGENNIIINAEIWDNLDDNDKAKILFESGAVSTQEKSSIIAEEYYQHLKQDVKDKIQTYVKQYGLDNTGANIDSGDNSNSITDSVTGGSGATGESGTAVQETGVVGEAEARQSIVEDMSDTDSKPTEVMFKPSAKYKRAVRGELFDLPFGLKGVIVYDADGNGAKLYEYTTGSLGASYSKNTSWGKEEAIQQITDRINKIGEENIKAQIATMEAEGKIINPKLVEAKDKNAIPKTSITKDSYDWSGEPVTIHGNPVTLEHGINGIAAKNMANSPWAIYDADLGVLLGKGTTKTEAIANTNAHLGSITKEKYDQLIEKQRFEHKKHAIPNSEMETFWDTKTPEERQAFIDEFPYSNWLLDYSEWNAMDKTAKGALKEYYILHNEKNSDTIAGDTEVSPFNKAQIKRAMKEYPDAGLDENDSVAVAQEKINKAIAQKTQEAKNDATTTTETPERGAVHQPAQPILHDGADTAGGNIQEGVQRDGENQNTGELPDTQVRGDDAGADRADGSGGGSADGERDRGAPAHHRVTESNFVLKDDDPIIKGKVTRYSANIRAIKLLKQNKKTYTSDEKVALSQFTGWGGLQEAFYRNGEAVKGWEERARELKGLLSAEEYDAAERSVLDAFYTPASVINHMWSISSRLGFSGGRVLEPSAGVGRFIGLTPSNLKNATAFNAVELDPTTAKIASILYGKANVRNAGFQETAYRGDHAMVIGNPPYGDTPIYDKNNKQYNGMNIHNYFMVRSLDALQDGGILNFVVSSSFLDTLNPKAVGLINSKAKMIGAIRLPSNVFSDTGTKVTTDIVIFQKLRGGESGNKEVWANNGTLDGLKINQYFIDNPQMMIGDWEAGYRGKGQVVLKEGDIDALIAQAIESLPRNIVNVSTDMSMAESSRLDTDKIPPNNLYIDAGVLYVNVRDGEGMTRVEVSKAPSAVAKAKAMLEMKDILLSLVGAQIDAGRTDAEVEALRTSLNARYDAFVQKNGYMNATHNASLIRGDRNAELLLSLEKGYDKGVSKTVSAKSGEPERPATAEKADILTRRTARPKADVVKTENAKEALIISINEKGGVDIPFMESVTGKGRDVLMVELEGEVFYDEQDGYVTRDVFLSGDVKTKLAYTVDEKARRALEAVIPADLEAKDIVPTIGASWIAPKFIEQFMSEELGYRNAQASYIATNGKWNISGYSYSSKYGTKRKKSEDVLLSALNSYPLKVYDTVDKKPVLNKYETDLATAQVEQLSQHFIRWAYSDSARRSELVARYNEEFNRYVPIDTTDASREYIIPGMSDVFVPREHQRRAVYRAVFGNSPVLLNHIVGSGKTLTSQMIAMEWRRLGKAKKPIIVTLKSVVPQYIKEFKEAYPNANILTPSESDFAKDKRRMFLSRIATGDYDAIVMTHDQLQKLRNPERIEYEILTDEIITARESQREAAAAKDSKTVADIRKLVERINIKIEKLSDVEKDDMLSFDQLGIDGIIVDEAHYFKKLAYVSSLGRVAGMPDQGGSKRAWDLFIKTRHILQSNNGRNVVFMTGTPITNAIPEAYLLQKFLQYDELEASGMLTFDAWAKNYTDITTDIELSPTGKFKEKSRMKDFQNIKSLMATMGQVLDTVNNEDVKKADPAFRLPDLKGGKPTMVFIEPSQAQLDYVGQPDENGQYKEGTLVYRSENMDREKDNHLLLFTDASKMAIDIRMVVPGAEDSPDSKTNATVQNVLAKYNEFDHVRGTQLIFSDMGTPKGGGKAKIALEELIRRSDAGEEEAIEELSEWSEAEIDDVLNGGDFSVYDDIKAKLVRGGIPADQVAFVHDYPTKKAKEALSDAVKSGKIRVVLGSTGKLGTGVNVQERLVAVHHIDIPHTPAELQQRNGRIIRQGNKLVRELEGFEAEIFYYATKKTLDGLKWQTLERKAKFIEDFLRGNNPDSEGAGEESMSELAEQMKALASGNELLLEKMKKQRALQKLEQLKTAHELDKSVTRDKIVGFEKFLANVDNEIAWLENDIAQFGEKTTVSVGKKAYDKAGEFGEAIMLLAMKQAEKRTGEEHIGSIGKLSLSIRYDGIDATTLTIKGDTTQTIEFKTLSQSPTGLGVKIGNVKTEMAKKAASLIEAKAAATDALPRLRSNMGENFERQDELDKTRLELNDISERMAEDAKPKAPEQKKEEGTSTSAMRIPEPLKQTKEDSVAEHFARVNGYDEAGINYVPTYRVSGYPSRPAEDTIMLGERVVKLPTREEPINADSIRAYLKDIIGNRLYEAKLHNSKQVGIYRERDSSIRLQSYSDVEIMAHELAHYLDFFHKNSEKKATTSWFRKEILKNKDEIKTISYTTEPKEVISEGFAEFVRLWLTNYNAALMAAPNMVADFETRLAQDKELNTKMLRLQEGMHQFYYQGAGTRKYQGGELNPTAKRLQWSQRQIGMEARQKIIDGIHSIKRIEAEVKGDVAPDAMNSPYKALQLVNGYSSIVYAAMNIGVPTLTSSGDIAYGGKPLNQIFEPASKHGEERLRKLMDYFVARRAEELMDQGREKLIGRQDIAEDLKLAEEYPEFATIFDEYQEFNEAMLDFYVGMNYITDAQRENFLENNKNYVPFHRVIESVQNGKTVQMSNIAKRLTGGTHSLGDIMENILSGLESNIKEAMISRGKTMFYTMLEESGMGGVYATRVPPESKRMEVELLQQASNVARTMQELGLTLSKDGMIYPGQLNNDPIDVEEIMDALVNRPELLEYFSHGHPPQAGSESYIDSAIIGGARVYFETKDAELIEAMQSFNSVHHNMAMQWLMSVKNVMTWNITNNPLFYLPNFTRDTVSASALSKNGFVPVLSSVRGMYHFVTQSKVYKDFMISGAGYGTLRTTSGNKANTMRMLNVNRGLDVWNKILSGLAYGADMFEYGTRLGEFELAQKSGKSNWQAAFEGREISTDFAIKGANSDLTSLMATVPFMKAAINGIDKTMRRVFTLNGEMKLSNMTRFRNAHDELLGHKVKLYAAGSIIALASLALFLSNKDDERYKRLTRDQKLMYWHIFAGERHIKIPKPYDIGFVFASLPEIIANGIYTKHGEEALKEFAFGMKTMFSIGDISGMFQPILDHMTNTNWMGSPIVPGSVQNVEDKADQYTEGTALLYRRIGEATGASPILMQHYVDGYLGLTAKMIEEATENILWDKKAWGERPFARNPVEFVTYRFQGKKEESRTYWSEKYYEISKRAEAVKNSYKFKEDKAYRDGGEALKEYVNDKERQALIGISTLTNRMDRTLGQLKTDLEIVTYDKRLSAAQKEKIINDAYKAKRETLQKIVEALDAELKKVEE